MSIASQLCSMNRNRQDDERRESMEERNATLRATIEAKDRIIKAWEEENAALRELLREVLMDWAAGKDVYDTTTKVNAAIDGSKEPILFGDREEWVK